MPSSSVEDYLKALFKLGLQTDRDRVRTKEIAEELSVSLPSVTSMIKSLSESGFVAHERYRGTQLTPKGERAAIAVIRAHRLIEVFLVEHLGYSWAEVHEEAERLEHAMSERFTNKLDAMLGYPRFDPHGDPIPDIDGNIRRQKSNILTALQPGDCGVVARVLTQDSELLQFLGSRNIRPGVRVRVVEHDPFDGPTWLELIDGNGDGTDDRIALGNAVAALILVALNGDDDAEPDAPSTQ